MSTSIISQQSASVSEAHPSWAEPTVVDSAVTVDGESERVDVQALPTPPTVPTDSPGCNPEFDFNDPAYPDEDRVII